MDFDDISDDGFASEGEEHQEQGAGEELMGGGESSDGEEGEEAAIEPAGREAIGACMDEMELASLADFCDVACVVVDRAMGAEAEGSKETEGAVLECLIRGFEVACGQQQGALRREEANKASKHVQAKLAELRRRPKREAASKKKQRRKEKGLPQASKPKGASSGAGESAGTPAASSEPAQDGEEWEDELEEGGGGGSGGGGGVVAASGGGGGEEWEDELDEGDDGDGFAEDDGDDGEGGDAGDFADDDDDFADDDDEDEETGGDGGKAGSSAAGGGGASAQESEEAARKQAEEEEAARKQAEEEAALESKLAQMTEKDKRKRARIAKKFGEEPKDPKALREWQAKVRKYEDGLIAKAAMGLDASDSDSDDDGDGEGGAGQEADPEDETAAKMGGDIDEEGMGVEEAVTDRQKAEALPLETSSDFCDAIDILCNKAVQLRKDGGRSAPLRDALRDLLMAAVSQGCENKEGCLDAESCMALSKSVDTQINNMIKAFNKKHVKKGSKGAKFAGKGKVGMGVRLGDSIADQMMDDY